MGVRSVLVGLGLLLSLLAGLMIGERFNVRPLAFVDDLGSGASFGSSEKESAFVRFLPSCFGQAAIHSCASRQLQDPVSIFRHIERVVDFDERSRFVAATQGVGRIDIEVSSASGKVMDACTAFMITDRHVMTAFHCTLDLDGNKPKNMTAALLRLGYRGDAHFGKKYAISCAGAAPSPCQPVEGDHQLDFAIFELTSEAAVAARADGFAPVKFAAGADKLTAQAGQDLFVVHHPYGREQFVTRAQCRARSPIDPLTARFYDTCATLGGSSGAPVFDEQSAAVIGMRIQGDQARAREAGFLAATVPLTSVASRSTIVRDLINPPVQ